MDNRSLRIALLLLVIYLAGLATGRFLTPPKTEQIYIGGAGPGNDPFAPEKMLEVIRDHCRISPEQSARILPLLVEWRESTRRYPPRSRPQLRLWEEVAAKIEKEITAEQKPAYQKLITESRLRIERRITR